MSRPSRSRLLGTALAALIAGVAVGIGPALAEPVVPGADESPAVRRETLLELSNPSAPDKLPELKSKAAGVISVRQVRLTQLAQRVSGRDNECSRSQIATLVAADQAALNSMGAQLAAETDVKRAKDVYRRMYTDLRIYGLESPRVYLSGACSAVLVRAAAAQVRIAALTTDPPRNADAGALAQAIADLPGRVTAATAQAKAAVEVLVDLNADKGDKATAANNLAVLRSAADQLRAAEQDMSSVEASLDGFRRVGQKVKDVKDAKAARLAASATTLP